MSPETKILVLSDSPTIREGVSALRAGAKGYCSPKIAPELLNKAIRILLNGELWAGRKIVSALVEEMLSSHANGRSLSPGGSSFDSLTGRKRQIAELIIQGRSNKAIAERLNISVATVKSHLTEIFHHFGVSGRLELAALPKPQTTSNHANQPTRSTE